MGRPIFSNNVLEQPRQFLMSKKYSEIFFAARVISKNKLEIFELFADFYQIVKIETPFLQKKGWAGLFFHTVF